MIASEFVQIAGQAIEDEVMALRGAEFKEARDYAWASELKPCARQVALNMACATRNPVTAQLAAMGLKGKDRERSITALLVGAGQRSRPPFEVVEGQVRAKIKGRDGSTILTGKMDGRLQIGRERSRPVFEIKSPMQPQRLQRYDDFAKSPYTIGMPWQLLMYLYSAEEEWGLLVIDTGGLPRLIPVVLADHWEEMERALQIVEDAVYEDREAKVLKKREGSLPGFCGDMKVCKACPFFMGVCSPPIDFGDGVGVITDEGVINALETRARTKAASKEYADADAELKLLLKGAKFEAEVGQKRTAVAGRFLLTVSWQRLAKLDLPKELKAQYETVNLKGKYMLDVKEVVPVEEGG